MPSAASVTVGGLLLWFLQRAAAAALTYIHSHPPWHSTTTGENLLKINVTDRSSTRWLSTDCNVSARWSVGATSYRVVVGGW